jgi:hypothetical protein
MSRYMTNKYNGDRFIPNREGQDLQATYSLLHEEGCPSTPSRAKRRAPHGELHFQKSESYYESSPACLSHLLNVLYSGGSESNVFSSAQK